MNNQPYAAVQPPQFASQQPQQTAGGNWGDDVVVDMNVEPAKDYDLIPSGKYRMKLERVNQERTNANQPMAACMFTITDEKQNNRKVFMNLMPHVYFQIQQAKSLAVAVNRDTSNQQGFFAFLRSLIDLEFVGRVGVEKNAEYGDRNRIFGFERLTVSTQQPATPSQQYQPVQPIKPQYETALNAQGQQIFKHPDGNWYLVNQSDVKPF